MQTAGASVVYRVARPTTHELISDATSLREDSSVPLCHSGPAHAGPTAIWRYLDSQKPRPRGADRHAFLLSLQWDPAAKPAQWYRCVRIWLQGYRCRA